MKSPVPEIPQPKLAPIPRDLAAGKITRHFECRRSFPLLTIHGPSGVGKSHLGGLGITQRLRVLCGSDSPSLISIPVSTEDTSADIAVRVTDQLIDQHAAFASRRKTSVFREKMRRSASRQPKETASRLRFMMRHCEVGDFSLKSATHVVHIDGLEKLFVRNRGSGAAPLDDESIGAEAEEIALFLGELAGMKSVLFTVSYRSWVASAFEEILREQEFDPEKRFDYELTYPDERELIRVVRKMLIPIGEQLDQLSESDELGSFLIDSIKQNPPSLGLLPSVIRDLQSIEIGSGNLAAGLLDRYLENNGMAGHIASRSERLYWKLETAEKLAAKEICLRIGESEESSLLLPEVAGDPDFWSAANQLVANRTLSLEGGRFSEARLTASHDSLLSTWPRSVRWIGAENSVGLSHLRKLDDKALSWEIGDRRKALLIDDEDQLEIASLVLQNEDLCAEMSLLTREFIQHSLRRQQGFRDQLWKIAIPVFAAISLFFVILTAVILSDDPGTPSREPGQDLRLQSKTASKVEDAGHGTYVGQGNRTPTGYTGALPPVEQVKPVPQMEGLDGRSGDDVHLSRSDLFGENTELENPAIETISLQRPLSTAESNAPSSEADLSSSTAPWVQIFESLGSHIETGNTNRALDGLTVFHEKTVREPDQVAGIEPIQVKELAALLGKLALQQKDRAAMQAAWKEEMAAQSFTGLTTNFRMLMARIALNEGREKAAVSFLAETSAGGAVNRESIEAAKAAVGFYFGEKTSAAANIRTLLNR